MRQTTTDVLDTLNPADYFTLAMDEEIRKEGMPGSLAGFALKLDRTPNSQELADRIHEFTQQFPVAVSSLQQRGRHFYWCKRDNPPQVFFQHHCPDTVGNDSYLNNTALAIMNRIEPRETIAPIEFHLITSKHNNTFLIRWIHPLTDARGADLILKYLCTKSKDKRDLFDKPASEPLVNVQLKKYRWWQKIGLFLKGKRYVQNIDKLRSILPVQSEQPPRQLQFSIYQLTEEQTTRLGKQAREQVGLTGTSLYYIGCFMRALEKMNPQSPGDAYCVPYVFNLRKQKALSPFLGNHVCSLFAQASRDIVRDRSRLFQHLKQQNTYAIRNKLDYAFLPLMAAGRWLSLQKYGETLRKSFSSGEERPSFWFSDIGQPDISGLQFLGTEITGMFHLCQITSPPGLALLSCQYQNKLTFTYNYMAPLYDDVWIDQLHRYMLTELVGEE
jgi:hypothetical protein